MELSSEDALRLNVLLANQPQAIRINESSMTLFGLFGSEQVTISLTPSCNDDKYLKLVRAFLSERALGSPGGYPFYLQCWTRMGQMREESLERLLLLGDPAAVFAVVCAEGLSSELSRRAWWASDEAENARRMLQTEAVVNGSTGPELARFLVEYLPFETEAETMIESVRMVLQPRLLDNSERLSLWKKASRKTPYLVGFISALPDELPDPLPPRGDIDIHRTRLAQVNGESIGTARLLLKLLSPPGRTFLSACRRVLNKPPTQDVVTMTLDVIRDYCSSVRPTGDPELVIEALQADADDYMTTASARQVLEQDRSLSAELKSVRFLSGLGYGVVRPLIGDSSAIGSLMCRKLKPALDEILRQIDIILGFSD
ncbi:MAG: sulfur reduction protein DsrS [Gammaproteobacteria bacterium]|nr:sulfur reduction protein DsrS [Gammaproteobacteria bacterium]